MITTVDQKGSVPLPKGVLPDSRVQPGDDLEVSSEEEDMILRQVVPASPERLLDILRGLKGLPITERSAGARPSSGAAT